MEARSNGTIVVAGTVGGRSGVFAVSPGGGFTRLALGISSNDDVYPNPAGTKLLVVVPGEVTDHAFLLDVAGGKRTPVRVPHLYGVSLPAQPWAPDGRRLLLMHGADTTHALIYTVATGREVGLGVADYDTPVWSGDGKSVIFGDHHSVYTIPERGGRRKVVARFSHLVPSNVQSSADGKWISFVDETARPRMYVSRADGSRSHAVAGAAVGVWSPSGERLAYAGYNGVGTLDPATGKRSFVANRLDSPTQDILSWSAAGTQILFERIDVAGQPDAYEHLQLWAMRPDGSRARPLTRAFPVDAGLWRAASWVAASLSGKPVARPSLVAVRPAATLTTALPVVSLSVNGARAAIAEGFGHYEYMGPPGQPEAGGPLGPILLWSATTGSTTQVAVHGCRHVPTVVSAVKLGYICDNSEYEGQRQSLRVGSATLARTSGGQGIGSFFQGTVTDGRRVVFGVEVNSLTTPGRPPDLPPVPRFRIYEATPSGRRLLRRVKGYAEVQSVEGSRIALSHGPKQNTIVVYSGHAARAFRFPHASYLQAALDGNRLVTLGSGNLIVSDLRSGREVASWPTGPDGGTLEGASGNLAVFVAGAEIHVMRLSDGREIVLDLGPNAAGPALADFWAGGLFYAYNEAYTKHPGRVAVVTPSALERAISAHGRLAR